MKKTIYTCVIIFVIFVFSGCSKVIDLTDEENYLIAEYAAELLLKYDRNYDMKYTGEIIDSDEETTEEITTEAITTEEITTEAITTEAATEQPDVDHTTEDSSQTTSKEESDSPDGQGGNLGITDVSGVKADVEAADFDLAKFVDEENVSIQYAYYMTADSYPSHDKDGMFIEIEAPTGYKLLVVKFDIENLTNDEQSLDMYSKDITYNIILNDSKSTKQMLTILIDDLYTYEYKLDGSSREEAVLLFQVADSIVPRIQDVKLKVTYKDKSCVIQLH